MENQKYSTERLVALYNKLSLRDNLKFPLNAVRIILLMPGSEVNLI